uniref:Uncharacterized protein n=1 Tax=Arundo donax TaxID=35708 RepID=A0A0A9FBM9_ARUDO
MNIFRLYIKFIHFYFKSVCICTHYMRISLNILQYSCLFDLIGRVGNNLVMYIC